MDKAKRERLEAAGFQVGTVADFLRLTPDENEAVERRAARPDAPNAPKQGSGPLRAAPADGGAPPSE